MNNQIITGIKILSVYLDMDELSFWTESCELWIKVPVNRVTFFNREQLYKIGWQSCITIDGQTEWWWIQVR